MPNYRCEIHGDFTSRVIKGDVFCSWCERAYKLHSIGKKYHKEVYAAKIKSITEPASPTHVYELIFVDSAFSPRQVPRSFIKKYKPQPGWYFVDHGIGGGSSLLSADVFEMQYTLSPPDSHKIADYDLKPLVPKKKKAKKTKGKSNG